MSQEENDKELTTYYSAIESFECLESLFHNSEINHVQIIQELQKCYNSVENIMAEESTDGSYVIDLFQMKQHLLKLSETVQNKLHTQNSSAPASSSSRIQPKERTKKEKPINIIETTIETPKSNGLKDIAGLWEVKKVLKTLVVLPQNQPQLFVDHKACNSVLLFGPPGTGKTRLAHALAYEANAVLHSISVGDLLSPFVGQTEKNVQALFDHFRVTENFSILFIDEIDGLCRTRKDSEHDHTRRLKTELMCQMSNLEGNKNMFLICATNCPWDLDTAFLRRFQKRIYIPLPNPAERYELFQLFTKNTQLENNADFWQHLVNKTEGFSGSDLSSLVNGALNVPIIELEDTKMWNFTPDGFYEPIVSAEDFNQDNIICRELGDLPYCSVRARPVQMLDILSALDNTTATVSNADIAKYEAFSNR